MSDENGDLTRGESWRWGLLALLILACLVAYFVAAPRVPPAIPVLPQTPSQ